jgi:hypothetical protein
MASVSALLDLSVMRLAEMMEPAVQEHTVRFGDRDQTFPVIGVRRKGPFRATEVWKTTQLAALPTLRRLVLSGQIRLFWHPELTLEAMLGHMDQTAGVGHLLHRVPIGDVPPAIERSRFQQIDLGEFAGKESFNKFCELLLQLSYRDFAKRPRFLSSFSPFEQQNLRALERFKEICRALPKKHYRDGFHLWTAEANGLDYFLTADGKFIRALTQSSKLHLQCRPIGPDELLTEMGMTERDPLPVNDYDFHTYGEVPPIDGKTSKGRK